MMHLQAWSIAMFLLPLGVLWFGAGFLVTGVGFDWYRLQLCSAFTQRYDLNANLLASLTAGNKPESE